LPKFVGSGAASATGAETRGRVPLGWYGAPRGDSCEVTGAADVERGVCRRVTKHS